MTKERKAAIAQWERIKEYLAETGEFKKFDSWYRWQCNCWFCHYVRIHDAPDGDNGCRKCPLWKYAVSHNYNITKYDCGCTSKHYGTLYGIARDGREALSERLAACDLITRALKGERIWE